MKQNRLFTAIYVVGTALSIALTMTLFIIFYVKFAPVYPEYNRPNTMVIKGIKCSPKGNPDSWSINGGVAWHFVNELLPTLPHAEAVAGTIAGFWEESTVSLPNGSTQKVAPLYVNTDFWTVFTFRFLSGRALTQEEIDGNVAVAVISESLARTLFATADVVERHIQLDGKDYRVVGVVADVSNATPATAGDLYLPILLSQWGAAGTNSEELGGSIECSILARDGDTEALKAEVEELVKQHNLQNTTYEHNLLGQPYVYWQSVLRGSQTRPLDLWQSLRTYLYMLLALLFIPALNLSGMISSRMDGRLSELGVRKAYGATNRQLINQVLAENLLLTVIGGLIGLLIAWIIVYTASDWILYLFDDFIMNTAAVSLTPEMLFSPVLFLIAFGLCLLLNLISALIPAVMALRRSIISSIHSKL